MNQKFNIPKEGNAQIFDRLHTIYKLARLKKKDFAQLLGLSARTLNLWESGKFPLSRKNASLIAAALEKIGIVCSEEWLLSGKGREPLSKQLNSTENLTIDSDVNYSTIALISFFERFYPDILSCVIEDYRYDPRVMPTTLLIGAGTSQDKFNKDWGYGYLYHFNKKQVIPIDIQQREEKLWGIPFAQMNYSADPFLITPEERIYPIINIRPLFSSHTNHTHKKAAA